MKRKEMLQSGTRPEEGEPGKGRTGRPEEGEPGKGRTGRPEEGEPGKGRTGRPEVGEPGKGRTGRLEEAGPGKRQAEKPEKDPERLRVLARIRELEREGRFDVDAEEDPPALPLEPGRIDYLRRKPGSRVMVKLSYAIANRFVDGLLREGKLVIREIRGMENLEKLDSGAILTCNHFNPFDCFTVEHLFRISGQKKKRQLFKVIREGNYTNFPGFYGFLFRNCNTLPLSRNKKTMYLFLQAVDEILRRGDFILIYPEQSLWWNYRKPKLLKNGAYKFAVKNGVPVLPIFITMEDGEAYGPDGFPVQEYTVFIGKAIYPRSELPERARVIAMREENYAVWKEIYESFYGIPLVYETAEIPVGREA